MSPATDLPAASRTSASNATTSPWRTSGFAGESVIFERLSATTRTSTPDDAPGTVAVTRALPFPRPVITPCASTATIAGSLDFQTIRSGVRSFALEKASALSATD